MKEWAFKGFRLNAEPSNDTAKTGQTPIVAKKNVFFKNNFTGQVIKLTDLDLKKAKRNRALYEFQKAYSNLFKSKAVSILLIVVKEASYCNVGSFITDFKKKLQRKGKQALGYVWARDIGDIKFEKHCHLVLATDRIKGEEFPEIIGKRKAKGYTVELCNNIEGFKGYLKKKELYAAKQQRSFGRSRNFHRPSKLKRINTH